ncbi:acyl carrier protein [Nocardia sp. NPDC005366]|uniref:acyl carrier protein n=1 Tax=Nocardia sp. NPDC005366 TaxID=3156878 RepID=UPI0033B61FED
MTVERVRAWLADRIACATHVDPSEISHDDYFDSFGLDSARALVLAGELETWLGIELEATALWYHPTVSELAAYIVSETIATETITTETIAAETIATEEIRFGTAEHRAPTRTQI